MNWGSFENFVAMGGYAIYVWGSYLVALGVLIAELVLLGRRKRRLLGQLRTHLGAERGGT